MRTWINSPLAMLDEVAGSGGVVIEDDRIVEILEAGAQPSTVVHSTFDATDMVLLPGLINTHHHYYQTLTRAVPAALNKSLFSWLKSLYPIWANLSEEMVGVATELASCELLLSGCTTSSDHHYLFPECALNAVDAQVEAVKKIGVRSVLTRGSMSLGEDQGGLPPVSTVQSEQTILTDCESVIDKHHDQSPGSMLQIALAPCSPFSVSKELMQHTADLARSRGVRLHTHLAETRDETDYCLREFGSTPLDYLEQVGWLSKDVWLAHGIHFNDAEIKRLGTVGTGVTHCPSSNMLLGSGLCPVVELEAAGCPVGVGVDGSASNDGSNMIQEVRQALLLQRLHYDARRVTHLDVLRWATDGSARCLGRDDIGKIEVGQQADLALFKLDESRFSGAADPLAALILCGATRAHSVMIAGRWRVRDGELVDLDLDEIMHRHGKAAHQLRTAV